VFHTLLDEVKHSLKTHMALMGGPTAQLCVFSIKIIDFLEDQNEEQKEREMADLSLSIVLALALYVNQALEGVEKQAVQEGKQFPPSLATASTNLLLIVARGRKSLDKLALKYEVLRVIASTLKDLGIYTNRTFPTITDRVGNPL
jgi:hypothetical protein